MNPNPCGFDKMVIVLPHPKIYRSEVLRVFLGFPKPKCDFNIVFHGKIG